MTRARHAWGGNWHAVWEVEWADAPVRGPLVAEVWHAADGRLRIETLEAPTPALSSLVLVHDGQATTLYDIRQNRVETGPFGRVRIPLASEALEVIDWLLTRMDAAAVEVSGRDTLESGPASRLKVSLANGDQATLWVHDETGLPSRLKLQSDTWGKATFTARSMSIQEPPDPALFIFPQEGDTQQVPGTERTK